MTNRNRALGALEGQAVGDALGTTLEFSHPQVPNFPTFVAGPHTQVTGGGPFGVTKGQVTDDTQMAVALATSLATLGKYDPEDVMSRYAKWRRHAFDIGGQTAGAISAYIGGRGPIPALGAGGATVLGLLADPVPAVRAGYESWDRGGRRAAGNGSLMRCSPLGVFFADDDAARRRATLLDSALTHADPRCLLACSAFTAAIALAIRVEKPEAQELADVAANELHLAAMALRDDAPFKGMFTDEEIDDALTMLLLDLASAEEDDPMLYEPGLSISGTQGFVRVAFCLAFWHLLHAPDFESALIDTVNRGGDADTNGAIVGALLGAFHGHGDIPQDWTETVFTATPPAPWDDTYHPRRLLALVAERA